MQGFIGDSSDPAGQGMFSQTGRFTTEKYPIMRQRDHIIQGTKETHNKPDQHRQKEALQAKKTQTRTVEFAAVKARDLKLTDPNQVRQGPDFNKTISRYQHHSYQTSKDQGPCPNQYRPKLVRANPKSVTNYQAEINSRQKTLEMMETRGVLKSPRADEGEALGTIPERGHRARKTSLDSFEGESREGGSSSPKNNTTKHQTHGIPFQKQLGHEFQLNPLMGIPSATGLTASCSGVKSSMPLPKQVVSRDIFLTKTDSLPSLLMKTSNGIDFRKCLPRKGPFVRPNQTGRFAQSYNIHWESVLPRGEGQVPFAKLIGRDSKSDLRRLKGREGYYEVMDYLSRKTDSHHDNQGSEHVPNFAKSLGRELPTGSKLPSFMQRTGSSRFFVEHVRDLPNESQGNWTATSDTGKYPTKTPISRADSFEELFT